MNERKYEAAEREMDIYRKQIEECEDRFDDALQKIENLEQQNAKLLDALEKAPRPMRLLTAEELKANWRAVDHWFAIYDAWVDDVQLKAITKAGG